MFLEELDFGHYEFHDAAAKPPLSVFAAAPPKGGSIVTLSVQVQTENEEIGLVVSGSTWNFRTQSHP